MGIRRAGRSGACRKIPRLALALAALTAIAAARFPASAAPGEQPDSVLLVLPQDGRSPQPVRILQVDEAPYVSLLSLARSLGVRFLWDPFTYRGWIECDSARIGFTMGSPFMIHGGDGWQAAQPVRYTSDGVLLPLDVLAALAERWNREHRAIWNQKDRRLTWGGSSLVSFRSVRLTQVGHRTTLRIPGKGAPRSSLRWSPVAGLELLLDGWMAAPESLLVGAPRGVLAVEAIDPRPGGSSIRVAVGSGAVGASARYDEREQVFELTATTSREEVVRGGFRPLGRTPFAPSRPDGPVVLLSSVDPVRDPTEAGRALSDLAHRVAEILSGEFGLETNVLDGQDPLLASGQANRMRARCFLGLRLESYPGAKGIQVWYAAPRLRWEALGDGAARRERPLLWSEAPALTGAASRELASTLASHLSSLDGEAGIQAGRRPTRFLEGLTMPGVLVYPATVGNAESLRRLLQADQRESLARALAFGIAEALRLGRPEEPRG